MPFIVPLNDAKKEYPQYDFLTPLTPSEQKAAFHVRDHTGDDLCLKIIAPNYSVDRLQREIIALQTINHPNVVKLKEYTYSSTPTQVKHYIVEEFVVGDDLSARLTPGNAWARPDVARFFTQLCEGLAALCDENIVHRDLKPSNIRVRGDGTPVIIDFGLARLLDKTDLTLTAEGAAIGTPIYFSPEQFTGTKRDIDPRTDIFAVGILMYQALTGGHPFEKPGITYSQLSDAVCNSTDCFRTPSFLALPKEWQLLVRKLMEKERVKRTQSARQIQTILAKVGGI
jgi:serine/threonine protein kinase